VRVRAMSFGLSTPTGRDLSEIPDGTRIGDKTVLSGIKWVLDGTPIEHGAAVRKPYADAPNSRGLLNFSAAEIRKMLEESLRADQQLLLHCSGDRCAETVLDEMKSLGADVDWPAKRVRIEHGDGLTDDLLQAAKKMGVIVVQNPTHFSLDAVPASRYGKDAHFFPLRTYFDLGMHAALGSDGPMNPFLNIMLATIHPRRPSEAISRETAVRAYTYGSAFAEFAETRKGTIASGQLADIVVLSQDIFEVPVEALPGTRSVLTIVGGKIVFDPGTLKE
jgi:predicted amidohydrolase YtcJ